MNWDTARYLQKHWAGTSIGRLEWTVSHGLSVPSASWRSWHTKQANEATQREDGNTRNVDRFTWLKSR